MLNGQRLSKRGGNKSNLCIIGCGPTGMITAIYFKTYFDDILNVYVFDDRNEFTRRQRVQYPKCLSPTTYFKEYNGKSYGGTLK